MSSPKSSPLHTQPRLVGIDYGTKRVGLALADPLRLFAYPHGTFSPDEAVEVLRGIHRHEGIEVLVVGWPLMPDGSEGIATDRVQQFINRLRNAFSGVEIVKRDERHTSEQAKAAIRAAGARRKARRDKARVDAAAATLILQDYLDNDL